MYGGPGRGGAVGAERGERVAPRRRGWRGAAATARLQGVERSPARIVAVRALDRPLMPRRPPQPPYGSGPRPLLETGDALRLGLRSAPRLALALIGPQVKLTPRHQDWKLLPKSFALHQAILYFPGHGTLLLPPSLLQAPPSASTAEPSHVLRGVRKE